MSQQSRSDDTAFPAAGADRPWRVLLVDDHPLMRLGAAACISGAPDCVVVGEADSAESAIEQARSLSPDVVMLDIRLGGAENGISLARHLRKLMPEIKIIVFTNFPHDPYVRAMMEIGVDAYLLKDMPPAELRNAIRMVANGNTVFSSEVSSGLVEGYLRSPSSNRVRPAEPLTAREAEVLQLVSDGRTNDEIAEDLSVSVKSVQAHLTSLYGKLGATNRTAAVIKAARLGLVVIDKED